MVIVFFGTPAFAVPSLEALMSSAHRVAAVVSQPDRPRGRGHQLQPTPTKVVGETHGVAVLQPPKIRDAAFLQQMRDLRPDLGVVVAFGRILSDALIAIPRLGMINVHASILPRYRGAAPIQRAVIAGEPETGVTIMRIATELDAGPTFATARVPIPVTATSGDMEGVLAPLGARLLLPVVDDLAAGRAIETPQDHALATFAPKVSKEEGVVDWSAPAAVVHNRVRGLQPWPLASTTLRGARYVLRRTAPARAPADDLGSDTSNRSAASAVSGGADLSGSGGSAGSGGSDGPGGSAGSGGSVRPGVERAPGGAADQGREPGTIVRARGDELFVACGAGSVLQILEIQPEGRRIMSAREFLAGRGVAERARFGT